MRVTENITLYAAYRDKFTSIWVDDIPNQTYTGLAIKPEVSVYYGEEKLIVGTDYYLSYKNNKNVNDALVEKKAPKVTVVCKGNYSGTFVKTFAIVEKELNEEEFEVHLSATDYEWTGGIIMPTVRVYYKNKLFSTSNYTISYPDNGDGSTGYKEPGTWTVRINGRNGYSGFMIVLSQSQRRSC